MIVVKKECKISNVSKKVGMAIVEITGEKAFTWNDDKDVNKDRDNNNYSMFFKLIN